MQTINLPADPALEAAVLGAIMLEKDVMPAASKIIEHPNVFSIPAHQTIYKAIQALWANESPIDILTVCEHLSSTGELKSVGGRFYVTSLTNTVNSATNIEYHARVILEKYLKRQMHLECKDIALKAIDPEQDVFKLQSRFESVTAKMAGSLVKDARPMFEVYAELKKRALEPESSGLTGIPSGFSDLDKITRGWQPKTFTVIAARPAMGKSLMGAIAAMNAAKAGHRAHFFSLEMGTEELILRLVASEMDIEADRLKSPNNLPESLKQLYYTTLDSLLALPLTIDDTAGLSISQLNAKSDKAVREGCKIIFVDYLQLMNGSGENNREQEIASISRNMKGLSKKHNMPVIAFSQLSRAVETRGGDKKPQLSDLRESGSIEQDADLVIFVYRGEYYGMVEDHSGQSIVNIMELLIAKHRAGRLEDVRLECILQRQQVRDIPANRLIIQKAEREQPFTMQDRQEPQEQEYKPIEQNGTEDFIF